MKGIYINYNNPSGKVLNGVDFKIKAQIDAFNYFKLNCKEVTIPYQTNRFFSVLKRLPFFNVQPTFKYNDMYSDVDYIYFRRPYLFKSPLRNFLKKIKNKNNKVKIIIELPTFPYDGELKNSLFGNFVLKCDIFNRKRLHGLVDRFATLTNDKYIFGIPTLKIDNGINFSNYRIRKFIYPNDNTINMCAIAFFSMWHGYERIIKGIFNYYKNGGKRHIIVHIVGDGAELPMYKKLVSELKLNEHFIFYGYLDNFQRSKIYDICSLCLGTFGAYKVNINDICNLKSTESLAYGIPIVNGCRMSRFTDKKYKYFLELPNNSLDVDINKIIEFNDEIYKNETPDNVTNYIRKFGEKYFSMETCMKEVIEYIKN